MLVPGFWLLGGKKNRQLNPKWLQALNLFLRVRGDVEVEEDQLVSTFLRMKVKNTTFFSKEYQRAHSSNNYTVVYMNALDQECYGEIVIYLQHETHNLAVIQTLAFSNTGIASGLVSGVDFIDRHLDKKYFLSHVVPVLRTDHIVVIPIHFMTEKVMSISCKGVEDIYLTKFPNIVEHD